MAQQSKIKAYLGFALRAGKLTLGVQAGEALRKNVYLLVADTSVAPNNRKKIEKLQRKFSCPLVYVEGLEEMTGKANCKLALVREKNLAGAILAEERKEEKEQI